MENKLNEICKVLDQLIEDRTAHIYVDGQHAIDESLMFGTADAYLSLAVKLLEFVVASQQNAVEIVELEGITVQTSNSIIKAFHSISDIRVNSCDLVRTEAEAKELFYYWWNQNNPSHETAVHITKTANYQRHNFEDCNFKNVELKNCVTTGMVINGVSLEDLIDNYIDKVL